MPSFAYKHQPGSHADVFKSVMYVATIQLLQKKYPDGIVMIETHSGPGVYDGVPPEFYKGAAKVIEENLNAPAPIKKYVSLLNKLRGEFGEGTMPGSPLYARDLMRDEDEHRLCDMNYDDVEGLYEDAEFRRMDAYDDALEYLLPDTDTKHPVILIDPAYEDEYDWVRAKELLSSLLSRKPDATILFVAPLIRDDRNRFSYPTALKAIAKEKASVGRYFATVIVDDKDHEGTAILLTNPTNDMDAVISEDVLKWMATAMHKAKADYTVEQAMKKKKKHLT
jgi:23S rRNA A2030 N6-methylase RlmJ